MSRLTEELLEGHMTLQALNVYSVCFTSLFLFLLVYNGLGDVAAPGLCFMILVLFVLKNGRVVRMGAGRGIPRDLCLVSGLGRRQRPSFETSPRVLVAMGLFWLILP